MGTSGEVNACSRPRGRNGDPLGGKENPRGEKGNNLKFSEGGLATAIGLAKGNDSTRETVPNAGVRSLKVAVEVGDVETSWDEN